MDKSYNTSSILETKNGDIYAWQNYVRPESEDTLLKPITTWDN